MNMIEVFLRVGARSGAVAQWFKHCATNRKVAGSIPDGIFNYIILPAALWPWVRLIL
jgi:hypothetical protein